MGLLQAISKLVTSALCIPGTMMLLQTKAVGKGDLMPLPAEMRFAHGPSVRLLAVVARPCPSRACPPTPLS